MTEHNLPMTLRRRANKTWQTVHKPQRKAMPPAPLPQQGDHNVRQDLINTEMRQRTGQKSLSTFKNPASRL